MNKYRRLAMGVPCVLLLFTLSACIVPMPGRVLLNTPRSDNAYSPVAAVETDGTRHFAWTEPVMGVSRQGMVYARANPDGTFYLVRWYSSTPEIINYGEPDLVVADNGIAYLAYTACSYDYLGSHCSALYSVFAADWHGTKPLPLSAGVGDHDLTLVQRGSAVYVLGMTPEGTLGLDGSHISYKQLAGGSRQGLVADPPEYFATDPSAVIDAAGDLHVAFRSSDLLGANNRIGYTSNVGSTGDMAAPAYKDVPAGFPTPAISRSETSDEIFVTFAVQTPPSDSLYVWQPHPAPVPNPISLALGPATGWRITGSPALVATGTHNYRIIFSASNSASSDSEIWTYAAGDSSPYQVTDDAVEDGPPVAAKLIGIVMGQPFEFPIYAWRNTYPDPQVPAASCFGDVKVVADDFLAPIPRTIFRDKGTCANYGHDLAVNGDKALGVWLDKRDDSSVLEPWYSTGGTETFIPAIRK